MDSYLIISAGCFVGTLAVCGIRYWDLRQRLRFHRHIADQWRECALAAEAQLQDRHKLWRECASAAEVGLQDLHKLSGENAALKRDLAAANAALAVANERLSRFGPKPRGKCGRFVALAAE